MIRGKRIRRREAPAKTKARLERDKATLWLEVVSIGIARKLRDAYDPEELREVIRLVNTDLIEALEAKEKAEKAYEPFWTRVRFTRRAKKVKNAA